VKRTRVPKRVAKAGASSTAQKIRPDACPVCGRSDELRYSGTLSRWVCHHTHPLDPPLQGRSMSDAEKRLIKIYRLEDVELIFPPGATEEQRLGVIRLYHESEVDREYHGRGYRVRKWFTDEFLNAVHGGNG